MVSRPPTPLHLANDSTTEAIAGSHTQATTRTVGTITITARKIRSVPDTRTRPPERRDGAAGSAGAAGTVGRSDIGASFDRRPRQPHEVKIVFFWLSRLLVSPSMSLGFLRKV